MLITEYLNLVTELIDCLEDLVREVHDEYHLADQERRYKEQVWQQELLQEGRIKAI